MATNPKRQALALLEKLGGSYDEDHECIDAPVGMVFTCDQTHSLALHIDSGPIKRWPAEWKRAVWQDTVERLSYGVAPCTIPDCDICEENS